MEPISDLVAATVLTYTYVAVVVMCLGNLRRNHPRPIRAAVDQTSEHVARIAVWLVLVIVTTDSALHLVGQWGPWITGALASGPIILVIRALVLAVQLKRNAGRDLASPHESIDLQ